MGPPATIHLTRILWIGDNFFCGIILLNLDVWEIHAFGTPCSGLMDVIVTPYLLLWQHLIFGEGKNQVCWNSANTCFHSLQMSGNNGASHKHKISCQNVSMYMAWFILLSTELHISVSLAFLVLKIINVTYLRRPYRFYLVKLVPEKQWVIRMFLPKASQ